MKSSILWQKIQSVASLICLSGLMLDFRLGICLFLFFITAYRLGEQS